MANAGPMAHSDKTRLICVDDHPIVLEGLTGVLALEKSFEVVGTAATGAEALALIQRLRPDVAVMDLRLRAENGQELIRQALQLAPELRVLVLTSLEGDADVRNAIAAGAQGYLVKGCSREELTLAIRTLSAGQRYIHGAAAAALAEHLSSEELTPRERQTLERMARGLSNKEIAKELKLAEDTAKMHVKRVLGKLGVSDRTEAVTVALRRGLIRLE